MTSCKFTIICKQLAFTKYLVELRFTDKELEERVHLGTRSERVPQMRNEEGTKPRVSERNGAGTKRLFSKEHAKGTIRSVFVPFSQIFSYFGHEKWKKILKNSINCSKNFSHLL